MGNLLQDWCHICAGHVSYGRSVYGVLCVLLVRWRAECWLAFQHVSTIRTGITSAFLDYFRDAYGTSRWESTKDE